MLRILASAFIGAIADAINQGRELSRQLDQVEASFRPRYIPEHAYPRCTGSWDWSECEEITCSGCAARYLNDATTQEACAAENGAGHLLHAIEAGVVGITLERSAMSLLDHEQAIRLTRQRKKLEAVREEAQ